MDQITSGGKQSVEVDSYVYLNKGGRFSRRPNLAHRETLDGEVLRSSGDRLAARFLGDVTGDRVSDILVRDRPERVRVMMVKKQGDTLSILPKPIWEMRIGAKARIEYLTGRPKRPGFLVLEKNQILLVTF